MVREDLDQGKVEAADWGGAENKGEWRRSKGMMGQASSNLGLVKYIYLRKIRLGAILSLRSKSDGREK